MFVTSELPPGESGGAGVVVARLRAALEADGHEVSVVLAAPDPRQEGVLAAPYEREGDTGDVALRRSRAAAERLSDHVTRLGADWVEIQDFDALAFWALTRRVELGLSAVPIAVRMHGPVDLMAEVLEQVPDDWAAVRAMERASYRLADVVIVPSPAMGEVATSRFGVDPARIRVSAPPVAELDRLRYVRSIPAEVVVLGRLAEVKGSPEALQAAVELLRSRPEVRIRFVGDDGWHIAAHQPMREWLDARVPEDVASRVSFEPSLPTDDWAGAFGGAAAVVIASRFESFCLTAHEARRLGLPLVVADLPAYAGLLDESTGAIRYDGSPGSLIEVLERIVDDPALSEQLAGTPAPQLGDPTSLYREPWPRPRHPQSQAGLATAAVKDIEEPETRSDGGWGWLHTVPAPLRRAVSRVTPPALRRRLQDRAWVADARADIEDRRRRLVAAGPQREPVDGPEISVVIPVYNQGDLVIDAVASVFDQTFDSWEVVVVDDGSDDPATLRALDALDYPRIRLVRQENRGLPAARNAGINAATGRYIVPLDADDELLPQFMSVLFQELEPHPEAAVAHCWAELFGDVDVVWATRPYNPYQLLLSNSIVGCALVRREALEAVDGYDGTMTSGNEDWELWVRLFESGWGQRRVRSPLFRYRRVGTSMSTATESEFETGRLRIAQRHPDLYGTLPRLKRGWYPWVSVLVSPESGFEAFFAQGFDDAEIVVVGDGKDIAARVDELGWVLRQAADTAGAVAVARGKLIADLRSVSHLEPGAVAEAAHALESSPLAAAAAPPGVEPLVWRSWALRDPHSPHRLVREIGSRLVGETDLALHAFPDPEYTDTDPAQVRHQSPEVEGPVPEELIQP